MKEIVIILVETTSDIRLLTSGWNKLSLSHRVRLAFVDPYSRFSHTECLDLYSFFFHPSPGPFEIRNLLYLLLYVYRRALHCLSVSLLHFWKYSSRTWDHVTSRSAVTLNFDLLVLQVAAEVLWFPSRHMRHLSFRPHWPAVPQFARPQLYWAPHTQDLSCRYDCLSSPTAVRCGSDQCSNRRCWLYTHRVVSRAKPHFMLMKTEVRLRYESSQNLFAVMEATFDLRSLENICWVVKKDGLEVKTNIQGVGKQITEGWRL